MEKPSNLLLKLSHRLFEDLQERDRFLDRLIHPKSFYSCILWRDERPVPLPFEREAPLSWQPEFVDRLAIDQKPGQHPLHQQGAYYCLDFSSVFAISPLLTISDPTTLVIDVCASPAAKVFLPGLPYILNCF